MAEMIATHHEVGGGYEQGLVDSTVDTAIIGIRANQIQEQNRQQIQQNVIVNGYPNGQRPLADPDAPDDQPGSSNNNSNNNSNDNENAKGDRFQDKRIIYNSLNRGACYHAFAWLWCGCFEPKYKITASYAIGEEWESCCLRVTDSMAYESVDDVEREQNICFALCSCCPLCPCINDMANIKLHGYDESHPSGWKIKRIHNSTEVFNKLTRIVQSTNRAPTKQEKQQTKK